MNPKALPLVSAEASLSEHLHNAGIQLTSEGIRESLACLTRAWNREQAMGVMLEQLARRGTQLGAIRLSPASFKRRLTLATRAIEAAGVHPDEIIRVGLGVCGQRLLVEGEPETVPGIQAIDLLGRLTALDYALLDVTISAAVLFYDKSPARAVLGDEVPLPTPADHPQLPPEVRMPDDLKRVLETYFKDLTSTSLLQASHRLRGLGLFFREHMYGQPSPIGREVLRLSRA